MDCGVGAQYRDLKNSNNSKLWPCGKDRDHNRRSSVIYGRARSMVTE